MIVGGVPLLLKKKAGGGDPFFSDVSALLHMDGTDGSTTFTDETGKTWTASGNAQIDTAQSQFGGASGLFDGSGDYISTPYSADMVLENGDFTVECFVKLNATSQTQTIFSNANDTGGDDGHLLRITTDESLLFAFLGKGNIATPSGMLNTSAFLHVAVCRDSTSTRIYVDGVKQAEGVQQDGIDDSAAFYIGVYGIKATDYLNGWVDDFRLTKGVARYTGESLTVPTESFPNS